MPDSSAFGKIRQLCLKLKPILGSRVDQIYEAYLAEDTEGRDQIEHYPAQLPQLGEGEKTFAVFLCM